MEYYVQTKEPECGVDFDEAQGGLGILSKNFKSCAAFHNNY